MLKYEDANDILSNEFEEMKIAFDEDEVRYNDDTSHCFYSLEFVPFIVKQIIEGNSKQLEKIFRFIEMLFNDGDDGLVNIAEVSIVESLYYELDFERFKGSIFSLCGPLTRKSFDNMEYDESIDSADVI